MKKKLFGRVTALVMAVLMAGAVLTGCGSKKADLKKAEASPEWIAKLGEEKNASQLFVVAGVTQTTAYVSMHEKDASGNWKQIMTTPGYIGKFGLGKTKEGDGMTPVGEFRFNYAFGIASDPGCQMKYHKVTGDDYWSGDVRDGYSYNQMVSIKDLPDLAVDDSERIMDYEYQYQYCLNISYNEEGVPGVGSAIFLHCLGPVKPYTGGCVAIPKDCMKTVMQNVREDCVVVIDQLEILSPETWEEMNLKGAPGFGIPAAQEPAGSAEEAVEETEPAEEQAEVPCEPAAELEYWTDGSQVAESIREYVRQVCDENSDQYVPVEDRIAVFDMDGTFIGELFPTYVDTCMFVHRVLEDADYQPTDEMRTFAQSVRDAMNDGTIGSFDMKALAQHFAQCYSDLTVEQFQDYVREFKKLTPEGFDNLTYGTAFYKPMISVIRYLAANDFKVYVVSGTERQTARALVEDEIGDVVPVDRVIGSDFLLKGTNQGDADGLNYTFSADDELCMGDALIVKNLKMNKVSAISREIGKVPVVAFGNSTGDFAMAQYTLSNGKYEGRAYMLLCDDTDRDYGNPEKAASFKEKCDAAGYFTISMKNDFATIFGDDVRMNPATRGGAAAQPDNIIEMPQGTDSQTEKKAS
ncbi:MAG: haloacid dehalogenase-like hydrolase [Lachnospiraceae bacterium]|nr:haloacid dehalogenase-like hydrolase [Lachnospiraceae bacterium]